MHVHSKNKLSVLLLLALSLSIVSCGWFKKSKEKSKGQTQGVAVNTENLVPPDRRGIGSNTSGAELALSAFNPAMLHACDGQLLNPNYQALIDQLGGIQFGNSLEFFRNDSKPYLVIPYPQSPQDEVMSSAKSGSNETIDNDSAPEAANSQEVVDIKRADLIGKDGTKVIFLSKTHGLFLVETAGVSPVMTCTTMVPGDPKNFYVVNGHLILINNSNYGTNKAAIVVYQISEKGLTYKTHHSMEKQNILDSRMFNDTLVTYASLSTPSEGNTGNQPIGGENTEMAVRSEYWNPPKTEFIITAFNQITDQPKIVFEDILRNEKEEVAYTNGYGQADIGKNIWKNVSFKDFISATDKYFVVTKEVSETYIARLETQQNTYSICTNYNPKFQEVTHNYCAPIWNKVDNPGFDANFSCHSDTDFAQCVQANETKFVKSYWEYKGASCQEHSYWVGRCETYESKTVTTLYPILETRVASHLMIYKYETGSFIRFDDPTGAAPIAVPGSMKEHKSMQFRAGYLMMATSDRIAGTALRSYILADKALVFAGSVENMGPGEDLKAVLFTDTEAYIVTFLQKDPLFRIDLTNPAQPRLDGKLDVPGFSSQLVYHKEKLIGIGQSDQDWRGHVKVSLFDVAKESFLSEIDALELGLDMDRSMNNSATDDQLHHFVPAEDRLYIPYSGWQERMPSETFSKVCRVGYSYPRYRLSVFSVGARLTEESTLEFRGGVERVLEHAPGKALAFTTGSVNAVNEANGKFTSESVRELSQIEGIYTDPSLPAGMVIAKQVVRSGGQIFKLSFALGTRDQLLENKPVHVLEISDDLVSCLGEPEIQFYNNEFYLGHNIQHWREGNQYNDRTEIQISGLLGWRITDAGFQPLSDEELAAHKSRIPTYCMIRSGVEVPGTWEDLVEHEARREELYDCKTGKLPDYVQVLNQN